ncbi:MAG: hypothetical protein R3C02_25980 [Planctomycetaceae bacterium]
MYKLIAGEPPRLVNGLDRSLTHLTIDVQQGLLNQRAGRPRVWDVGEQFH